MEARHRLFELFDAHGDELYALAGLLTGDPSLAEPVVLAAFADVNDEMRGANPLDPPMVVDVARLRRAVCHRTHDVDAAPRGGPRPVSSEQATATEDERHAELLGALRSLPYPQRDAVVLHCWLDLDERALADSLGVSAVEARAAVQRGIAAVGARLEAPGPRQ